MELKLPEIVPARVIPSAADEIDRAGAKVKAASDAVAESLLREDLAQAAADTQEATLQHTAALNNAKHIIKSTPYAKPETVAKLFGGKVPGGIDLTEQVVDDAGRVQTRTRQIIPMHEVSGALFDRMATTALENSAAAVKQPGWRAKFIEAAKADTERDRADILEWQRGQRLADAEIRSVAQYQQFVDRRQWNLAQGVLDNANYTMSVPMREKLRAGMPELRALAEVSDRLQANDVAEIDKLIWEVQENKVRDPGKLEDSGLYAPLDAQKRLAIVSRAQERRNEIISAQERAEKAAREREFQGFMDVVQQAEARAIQTGGQTSDHVSVADIPIGFTHEQYETARNAINAPAARPTQPAVLLRIHEMLQVPGRLGRTPAAVIFALKPRLSPKDWDQLLDDWSKDKAEPGSVKSIVPEYAMPRLEDAVRIALPNEDEHSPKFLTLKAAAYDVLAYKIRSNPGIDLSPTLINSTVTEANTGRKKMDASLENDIRLKLRDSRKPVTAPAVNAYAAKVKAIRSEAEDIWNSLGGDTERDFTDHDAVELVSRLEGSERKRLEQKARDRKEANRATRGKPVTERDVMMEAVQEMIPEQATEEMGKREAEAKAEARVEELNAAGERELAQDRATADSFASSYLEGKEVPPELKVRFDEIDRWWHSEGQHTDIRVKLREAGIEHIRKKRADKPVPSHTPGAK